MIGTVRPWLNVALLTAGIAFAQITTLAGGDWEVIKVSGHDYLTIKNISTFYGLPAGVVGQGDKVRFETVKNPLEFVSGSREAMINGARGGLFFPLIEQDGKHLVSRTDVAKTIEPLVRPHRVANVGNVQTVVLDPGHGGYDKGQVSRYGYEKDFALDVARKLVSLYGSAQLEAVTEILHARLLAVAVMIASGLNEAEGVKALEQWERVSFRIFGLARKDSRTKVGDYVRLAYKIVTEDIGTRTYNQIMAGLRELGSEYPINEALKEGVIGKDCYERPEVCRYLLWLFEEELARRLGAGATVDDQERRGVVVEEIVVVRLVQLPQILIVGL